MPGDCPGADTKCAARTCVAGACGVAYTPLGTPIAEQVAGDCHIDACDGAGAVITVIDDSDAPDDANPCTSDTCSVGLAVHVPLAVGAPCNAGGGHLCNGNGACVTCVVDSDCPGSATACSAPACTAGSCGIAFAAAGTPVGPQVAGDCAVVGCNGAGKVALTYDAADPPPGKTCPSTTWKPTFPSCGTPPPATPATSLASCSVGVDPTKKGGDLLWVDQNGLGTYNCSANGGWPPLGLGVGPTGDIAVGLTCETSFLHGAAVYKRLNGLGTPLAQRVFDLNPSSSQDVFAYFTGLSIRPTNDLDVSLANVCQGPGAPPVCNPGKTEVNAPDGMTITTPPYVPVDGTVKVQTSTVPVDLGCGALPAAPGGSTFVTVFDHTGDCHSTHSLPAPNLKATMLMGNVVVSGVVKPVPVDLGGGPLAPLGDQDYVIVMFGEHAQHVWSKRFGNTGVSLGEGSVTLARATYDTYLITSFAALSGGGSNAIGVADFGGGVLSAELDDPIVVRISVDGGTHVWSRAYHFSSPTISTAIDGCGSFVVASPSPLTPGCGQPNPLGPAVARFAP